MPFWHSYISACGRGQDWAVKGFCDASSFYKGLLGHPAESLNPFRSLFETEVTAERPHGQTDRLFCGSFVFII